jgi:hypothetical protein
MTKFCGYHYIVYNCAGFQTMGCTWLLRKNCGARSTKYVLMNKEILVGMLCLTLPFVWEIRQNVALQSCSESS